MFHNIIRNITYSKLIMMFSNIINKMIKKTIIMVSNIKIQGN